MSYNCKILLDSISKTGKRLTTFEITFPRIVLAEFNTHRMFSRNSASSRAIPFSKIFQRVDEDPFIPERFPINGKGMQPNEYIDIHSSLYDHAYKTWLKAKELAMKSAKELYNSIGGLVIEKNDARVHKQIVNRLLEPFMWHTVIVTATEFDNFFKLRCDENAQYEIRRIADLMYEAYLSNLKTYEISGNLSNSPIQKLKVGEWHCPLVSEEDNLLLADIVPDYWNRQVFGAMHIEQVNIELLKRISVARCARVSYLTHDGKRDIEKDLELFERLRTSGHWSPFEHVATPFYIDTKTSKLSAEYDERKLDMDKSDGWSRADTEDYAINLNSGNMIGWKQYRKEFQDENCTNFKKDK